MTRLIVKNLPKTITEDKLRSLFGQKGNVTDIQLKYTKDGVFRQFAFIGYQTEDEANAAIKYFDNTCIQTSRVKVEKCAALGAEDKPKSWSKYSVDSSAYQKKHDVNDIEDDKKKKEHKTQKSKRKNGVDDIFGEHKNDPEFIEFLQAHDKNRTLWANDAGLGDDSSSKNKVPNHDEPKKSQKNSNEMQQESSDEGKDEEVGNSSSSDTDQGSKKTEGEPEKIANKSISDLEYMKSLMKNKSEKIVSKSTSKSKKSDLDLFTIKIHGIPYKTKRQEIVKFFKPNKPYSVRLPTNVHGFCYVGFKTEKEFKKAMLKNKSFLKGKQVFFSDFTEKNKKTKSKSKGEAKDADGTEKSSKWAKQAIALKSEEDISESGCIFFRNLAYTVTDDEIQKLFEKYGPIAEVNLPVDSLTRQIKGFGTVTFVMPEHAVQAFTELDGTCVHGRLLHLIPGKNKDNEENDDDTTGLSFKAQKALKLKKSAQQAYNWNTLFLGAKAVADILAKQFGESKETILDTRTGGSNAAVRLALGETQIVMEMKKFLEENDVQLEAFDTPTQKRSKRIILAKNLPAETTVVDLKAVFSKYGLLGRIVLPPSGVTALIEFEDSSEAMRAFKKLAYSKFKSLPLYLEWAPENVFKNSAAYDSSNVKEEVKKITNEVITTEKAEQKPKEEEKDTVEVIKKECDYEVAEDEPPEQETTLFLRNLNFKTREEAIRNHFKHMGPIHMVQVAMKKDPENPKNRISLGYGFIQFKMKNSTDETLKNMHFTEIEGNQVELKRSDRVLKVEVKSTRKPVSVTKQTGTKIVVRNIPFKAKVREIREIFQAFGHLKSVRLPKKATTGEEQHRGFGFVEYFDNSTAKKAFDALCQSTHLYGRRLVLEWAATTDNDVDELRKRTAESFAGSQSNAKRSKKAIFDSNQVYSVNEDEDTAE